MSKVRKGAYHAKRTRDWLEAEGYVVAPLQRSVRIYKPAKDGKPAQVINRTFDIWGADLMARNTERLIFIQVKSNPAHIAQGVKELASGDWPPFVERWVVYWPPRRLLRDGPEIVEVKA